MCRLGHSTAANFDLERVHVRDEDSAVTLPAPIEAAPKSQPNCDVTDIDEPEREEGHRDLDSSDDQGVIAAESISIAGDVTIEPTADLTLVAQSSLDVAGWIKLPDQTAPGAAAINVTLVCFDGPVHVSGIVGGGHAAPGIDGSSTGSSALAQGGAGTNGGWVRISARSIRIDGNVAGNAGGRGGNATAAAGGGLQPWHFGGAVGGAGGRGGDVLLCAVERVELRANGVRVAGGQGGRGGDAAASAKVRGTAESLGGPGSNGGDATIVGGGPSPLVVVNDGATFAGRGGGGGTGRAEGGEGGFFFKPANAEANGGYAGDGGDVHWVNATPTGGGQIRSAGGAGGYADATGGKGSDGLIFGGDGADAAATGGKGGVAGDPGGRIGNGGDASATGGNGGDARFDHGGWSGEGTAQGGENGLGDSPGPPVIRAPVRWTGRTGGVAAKAYQAGA